MNTTFERLRTRLAEISDLRRVNQLLLWDQQTIMPPAGVAARADQRATLSRLAHELLIAPEVGRMLDELRPYEESLDPDSDDAALVRVARRDYEKAVRVPPALREDMTRAASQGHATWVEAKERSDFARFLPALERHLELRRRYVECFDPVEEGYDVLLDDYERGMKTAEVRGVFDELKRELVSLTASVRGDEAEDDFLHDGYAPDRQEALSREVIQLFGHRPDAWRIDATLHPFASGAAVDDIRIATTYGGDFESFFSTIHEYGHGLYEHQVAKELERSPLGGGVSYGLHESQSRLWENLVGRGLPFWRFFYPRLQEVFPERLGGVDLERFYRGINRVRPSLIRTRADEVTYDLHVILRFEIEQDVLEGRVALRDLPDVWNERMAEYLGVDVPDDARGVLQDVHWGIGHFAYFPTYTLGNVMAVQIWDKVREDIPDLDDRLERGEFAPLREWLGERIHRHGRKYMPQETLERAVGDRIDPKPYLRYLAEKHGVPAA